MTATAKKKRNLNYVIKVALLSAIAFVLMYLEIPIGFIPPWLKLDFSDIPAILAAFSLGPVAGIICEFVKVLLFTIAHGTSSAFVGEIGNFIMGVCLVLPAGLIYKYKHTRKHAVISMSVGVICMTVASGIVNYFFLIPAYAKIMGIEAILSVCKELLPAADSVGMYCLIFAMPFTLIKSLIDCVVIFFCYKKLSPVLHKQYGKQKPSTDKPTQ